MVIVDYAGDEVSYSGDSDTDNYHQPICFLVWMTITC